jgi:hypothetical protein
LSWLSSLFGGDTEAKNISLNRATIDGLVDAYGQESGDWQRHVLTCETEKMRVGGRAVTTVYLVPEGYERVDDQNSLILSVAVPIRRFATLYGVLMLTTESGDIDDILKAERTALVEVFAVAFAALLFSSLYLAGFIAAPVSGPPKKMSSVIVAPIARPAMRWLRSSTAVP